MDEFRQPPREFDEPQEENDHALAREISDRLKKKKKEKRRLAKSAQYLCASVVTVSVVVSAASLSIPNHFSLYVEGLCDAPSQTIQLSDIRPDNSGGVVAAEPFTSDGIFEIEFDYFGGNETNKKDDSLGEGILISFDGEPIDLVENPEHTNKHTDKQERYSGLFGVDIALRGDSHAASDHVAILGSSYKDVREILYCNDLENTVHHIKLGYGHQTLTVEHDGELISSDHLPVYGNRDMYLSITASTDSAQTVHLIRNLRISGKLCTIDNPEHNSDGSICIALNWESSEVYPPMPENGEI